MTAAYRLSAEDACELWSLGLVVEDRSDDEHAALCRLADWLDAEFGRATRGGPVHLPQ
jgi:hypothetical protein